MEQALKKSLKFLNQRQFDLLELFIISLTELSIFYSLLLFLSYYHILLNYLNNSKANAQSFFNFFNYGTMSLLHLLLLALAHMIS